MTEETSKTESTTVENDTETVESDTTIKVLVKVSGGTQFELILEPTDTVKQAKDKAEQQCKIPVAQQRLIHKGRILKDADSLSTHNIATGHTMHLVRSSVPAAAAPAPATGETTQTPTAPTTAATTPVQPPVAPATDPLIQMMMGMGNPAGATPVAPAPNPFANVGGMGGIPGMADVDPALLQQMLSNPMIQQMMTDVMSNPEVLRSVTMNNPMLQQLTQGNPMVQQLLSDPQAIQTAVQMQQMFQNNQAGPAGATAPTTQGVAPATPQQTFQPNPMAFMMGSAQAQQQQQAAGGGQGANNFAQMMMQNMQSNPQQLAQMMSAMGGMMDGGASGAGPVAAANTADRFANELTQLEEMGFIDRDSNIRALQETGGNVNAAISVLLQRGVGN